MNVSFLCMKILKIHFHVATPFVKYLNFGQKIPIQIAHHTFLESIYPEVTKNPYYVLSSERSQKKVSAHGLNWEICLLSKSL